MTNTAHTAAGAHGAGPAASSTTPSAYRALPQTEPTVLLVWDAPNLDMGLGSILGGRPDSEHRPRFDALGRWLVGYTDELARERNEDLGAEATVFTNVSPGGADIVRPWVEAIRNVGFAVFAKPKADEDSDVDDDMVDHIRLRYEEGTLRGVIVASADGRCFRDVLEELAFDGIPATVIGFHEHCSWALTSPDIEFIDLEDIPGVFRKPLPRVNLDNLPAEGAWMQPLRTLSELFDERH